MYRKIKQYFLFHKKERDCLTLKYTQLLDNISGLLSDNYIKVEASENEIKEKICSLMRTSRERGKVSY